MIFALLLLAQPLALSADVLPMGDAGAATVGAPVRLVIEARHAPGEIAVLPESLELGAALAERRAVRRLERREERGEQIDRFELELIPFEAGELTIPPIPVAISSTTASTPERSLSGGSGLDEALQPVAASTLAEALAELEQAIADDPEPSAILVEDYRLLGLLGALALAGVFAWALMRWRRAQPEPVVPPPPPIPAHVTALERLERLLRRPRESPAEQKAYYVELSEILRVYIGARYGFDSIELTVEELFAALEGRDTPSLDRALLRRELATFDLVKFAKLVTDDEEAVAHAKTSRAIIEATRAEAAP